MSLRVLPSELTTATRTSPAPGILNVASFQPSMPRTAVKASGSGFLPVMKKCAERSAASITPPVAPKTTAAPVDEPRGLSNSSSGRYFGSMWFARSMMFSSRVVMLTSTSGSPSASFIVGSSHSLFLATHGMMETMKSRLGSMPIFSAK